MKISIGKSRTDKHWKNGDVPWNVLSDKFRKTIRTSETVEEYRKLSKDKQGDIKDVGGFVGGYLKDGKRKNGNVLCRSMLTLDMDYCTPEFWEDFKQNCDFTCCVYSTHKHTPEKPRLRLIIPLSRDISEDEYPAVARIVAKEIGIDLFDDTTYEPARLMYWASTSKDGEYFYDEINGETLNPDDVLAKYDDWRDASSWPVSSRQTQVIKRGIKKQSDPLAKGGVVGAFCRAYTIEDAIDTLLSDVYEPSAVEGRYDYIQAESSAGLVIYDNKFAYSHHATDPVRGMLLNAFDLVRLHRFGHLDSKAKPDTPVGKLPSYKAMIDFTLNDSKVKKLLIDEKQAKSATKPSGGDWKDKLEFDKFGNLKNNIGNLILILNNDKKLKPLVFNQLLDGIEIAGEVPWKHPSKYWRDADDAQLIAYIDENYGSFSQHNYNIAVTKVTDDRSYHPIRDYLNNLPEWDGVKRADTLLIDYLGALDNDYTRAVTRKTLCAAVKRVLQPGCKFDTMPVLNGPQGIGKSTLISKLAGEWFSDSLNLGDTKDKTAAEKLQGYWILEIGELAGLRKTEIETLRSFLSRQNDIYRASFGRRATPHPRQCIFFGTTNAEDGYLRDTTGNRRFWPVMTTGGGDKNSWDITQDEVNQIWAEVLTYVKAGEKLYLDAELEAVAKEYQREAMESDEREGVVREYLETLLPEDWDNMDLISRTNYLNGTEFGKLANRGTVKREKVSNIEIWCECFGHERSRLTKRDSSELTAIMKKLGWKRAEKKERIPLYGSQYIYVPDAVPNSVPSDDTSDDGNKI